MQASKDITSMKFRGFACGGGKFYVWVGGFPFISLPLFLTSNLFYRWRGGGPWGRAKKVKEMWGGKRTCCMNKEKKVNY